MADKPLLYFWNKCVANTSVKIIMLYYSNLIQEIVCANLVKCYWSKAVINTAKVNQCDAVTKFLMIEWT